MQTFITSQHFHNSAQNLDDKRLGAQIYEGIHILASNLGIERKLITPKRSVINHPAAIMWRGYDKHLFQYIVFHMIEWQVRFGKPKQSINAGNLHILNKHLGEIKPYTTVEFIDSSLVNLHRNMLIRKKTSFYKDKEWK